MSTLKTTSFRATRRAYAVSALMVGLAATTAACSSGQDDAAPQRVSAQAPGQPSSAAQDAPTSTTSSGSPTSSNDSPQDTDIMEVQVGDCLAEDMADSFDTVLSAGIVSCDTPHRSEMFHRETLPSGPYPGLSEISDQSNQICLDAFANFIGISYNDSELVLTPLYPLENGWNNGDYAIDCYVSADEDVVGSLRDSRR